MVTMSDAKGGGVIAGLALPSKRQAQLSRPAPKILTDEEKEKKEDQMGRILWDELFFSYHVGRCPDEYRFLLTEHVFATRQQREQIIRLFFEEYKTLALMFVPQELLALVSNGYETGIVVNMGYTYTSIVPIWKMQVLRDRAVVLPVGGQDVTRALELLLKQRRVNQVHSIADFDPLVVEHIKEKHGYVAADYEAEMRVEELKTEHELPDCQRVKLGTELFQCTEGYFQPHLLGILDTPGLIESVNELIDTLDREIRREIVAQSGSVFLTGSCSMFPGLVTRLQKGIREIHSAVKVVATPERKLSAWIGGSIWAKLSTTQSSWTTKEEFEAHGPSVVHSKCF